MTVVTQDQQVYEPPTLEVLGSLTSLATGAGPGGALIVMQTTAIQQEGSEPTDRA